jgi:nitrite reductase/ring-hydroxylating ferredoxin subunit
MQRVASSDEIKTGEMFATKINKTRLLLSRIDGQVYAVIDKCTHLNMPMRKGKFDGQVVTCPFHGSRFDIKNGENLDWVSNVMGMKVPKWTCKMLELGKKPAPLTTLQVEEKGDEVFVAMQP